MQRRIPTNTDTNCDVRITVNKYINEPQENGPSDANGND